ncbi:glycosyltransferase [Rhizobium rhizosphaerae]|uniref:glycosyltransferase n=1 Tax=Xaviernesmea rhizosphaerae TaxID=1672749 RepID=UPI000A417E2E|nr:glycosyltransferase [Xaviernesmea rhizosphaerae]
MTSETWFGRLAGGKPSLSKLQQRADQANAARNWSEAASLYEQVLAIDPSRAALWIQLGHCRKEAGDIEGAREAYLEAAERAPGLSEPYFHLAHMVRHRGDLWQGFLAFHEAYKADGNAQAASELALMIGTTDSFDTVKADVQSVFDAADYLELNPDIAQAGVDPLLHYLMFGWKEKRSPSHIFDPWYYEQRYKSQIKPGELPLVHFARNRDKGFRGNLLSHERWFTPKAPSEAEWAALSPARLSSDTRAVVILPVYKGYDETLAAVYHALSARGDAPYSLLVINDCGPDAALNAVLSALGEKGLFDYHMSTVNRGFVQTCNHAINELSGGLDVILLNSDAFVFPGWFERMIAHADRDPRAATITPLSNNATLCSYPVRDKNNLLALECSPAALNDLAGQINAGRAVDAPTGVGFCFYMRRSVIEEIGALDPVAFKLGYGEENDFCMRSLNAGYRNLIATDIFVFHVGSVSFSSTKQANFDAGQKALLEKHPNYPLLVQHHFKADPTRSGRRALDAARLIEAAKGATLILTHNWGGGIDTYLKDKKAEFSANGRPVLLMTVQDRHFVSLFSDEGIFIPNLAGIDLRTEMPLVEALLSGLDLDLVHLNSFAGLSWRFHKALLSLIAGLPAKKTLVVHDYAAVSHHYQLIRPDQIYAGIPTLEDLRSWTAMTMEQAADPCDVDERQEAYRALFASGAVIEAPSRAAADIMAGFYPQAVIKVAPHREDWNAAKLPAILPRRPDGRLRIALLGAIGPHKGGDLLLSLARDARARRLPIDYSIVGYSSDDAALAAEGVKITGRYADNEEAMTHLASLQPDLIFIPSIWAETYCYTLSIALESGIPPVVFDLGAQSERLRAAGRGTILDPRLINSPAALSDTLLALALPAKAEPKRA